MPLSNEIGPRTVRELQRMEDRIRGLKYEWKLMSERIAAAAPTNETDADPLAKVSLGAAAMAGTLRAVEDAIRAARAVALHRRLVLPEEEVPRGK